jgi:hypothetical protein
MARKSPDATLTGTLAGGFAAGLIDIVYAVGMAATRGVAPGRVFQSVATGLLGHSAYDGGLPTALLGGLLHFAMTTAMALLFIVAAKNFELLRRQLIIAGLAYGALIYFTMRWVIVPLSGFPGDLRTIRPVELAVHMFGVGLVIALVAWWMGALRNGRAMAMPPISASPLP